MSGNQDPGLSGPGPPHHRLAVRFGLWLCLGAAGILIAAGAVNLRLQRSHLTRLVSANADRIAETIRYATRDAMMRDNPQEVRWMIESIAAQPGISRIRIFNKLGRIRTSTDPAEIDTQVDMRAEQCVVCHQEDRPLHRLDSVDRVRIFRPPGGERILGIIAPIQNEPSCSTAACHRHDASQQVLGVLDVQLGLGVVDQEMAASERQLTVGITMAVAAMLLLAALLMWRLVLRPIRRLTLAMQRVSDGDLSARVQVHSRDEIGAMMAAWNTMTDQLGRARLELEQWGATLQSRVDEKTRDLEQAHQRMLLVEKMASLGKLAAVVAHEINNPLAGIRTYARLLLRRSAPPAAPPGESPPAPPQDESTAALRAIEEEAGRCGNIVRNLLMFSRSPGARLAEEEPGPLVERCAFLLRHQAEMKGVTLGTEVSPGLGRLVCDASQVQQMILALAMNAMEATPAGGSVTLSARPEGTGAVLVVSDTGTGIPPEDRDRIFEPFYTTKREGSGAGVGLGLAVVYGIVQRHGGRIEVESSPGRGSTFTIHLPQRPPVLPEGTHQEAHEVTA
jgi:two-component system NtrC family sensor kinase